MGHSFTSYSYNVGVKFTLRDFRGEDFDTLWKIDQACFAPGIAYSRPELKDYIARHSAFTLVSETDQPEPGSSPILGFIVADAGRRISGHIITIDVLPAARRFGVGSKLLQAAEQRLSAAGCRSVRLETAVDNTAALAFYKRQDYFLLKTIPHYYATGVDAFVLQKELSVPKPKA